MLTVCIQERLKVMEMRLDYGLEPMLTRDNAEQRFSLAARSLPAFPGGFSGRGIVIPGGGIKYFPGAWVSINLLRRLGCSLAIELWHLGPAEMSEEMRELVEPLGVRVVDAFEIRKRHPARILNGWELKPYAIVHSRFEEVLLLDADNVPVIDPTALFDEVRYREHGATFWPDLERLAPDRSIWHLTGVTYRDEPEFESGQIVVNKQRCWQPLALALWMNEHSDFWYDHLHGDKETFHLAWRKLDVPYAMPPFAVKQLDGAMCQHDFSGRRIFQHRNMAKWRLSGNRHIEGFLLEDECLALLDELRRRWEPMSCSAGISA